MNPLDKENALALPSSASALAAKSQTVLDRRKMLEEWRKKKQESQNKSSAPKPNNTTTVLPKKDFAIVKKPSASKASRVQTTKPTVNAVKSSTAPSSLKIKPMLSNNHTKSVPVGSRLKVTITATDSSNSRPASSVAKKPAVPSLQRKVSTMSLGKQNERALGISTLKSTKSAQVPKAQSREVPKKSTDAPVKTRVERQSVPQKLERKAREFLQKSMENSLVEKSTIVQVKEPCDVEVTAEPSILTATVDNVGMTPLAEAVIEPKSPGLVDDAAIASFEETVERQIDEIEKSLGSVVLCDPNINDTVMNKDCPNVEKQLNESLSIDALVSTSLSINDSIHPPSGPEEPELIIIDNNKSVASPPRADIVKSEVSRLTFSTPKTAKLHLKSKFSESAKKLSLLHNALEKANSKLTPAKLFADQIGNPTKASIQNLEDRFASLKVVDAVKSAPIASSPAVVNSISANTASTLSNLYSSPKPRSVPYRLK
ncbi:hypothetical protein BKA69DRAFT_104002 [Paraphysoderma sedebokerense]|nr:hypothetical protein BKA69DRAFT_104002 [Paraphysoderma sedebokerense]